MEGNVDDCNGESDQSDCHDKQSNLKRGNAEKRRLGRVGKNRWCHLIPV